ncbi:NAD(+) diphosphatase [Lachnospira multipara]|jgi:NAD+ diphosphatase|uniref:NAD(+) diphosphatase n=1 Tax=Lachnospira multipara TaxID=28051 RepID=UPI0005582DDF|nr:NAD(+) diphosphatase [Lachnospira multipara]
MIQDIFPLHLDNQYKNLKPEENDIIFCFAGATCLAKKNGEDDLTFPQYGEFLSGITKNNDVDNVDNTSDITYIYLFSMVEYKAGYPQKQGVNIVDNVDNLYESSDIYNLDSVKHLKRFFLAIKKDATLKGDFFGEVADTKVHKEYVSPIEGYEFVGVYNFRTLKNKAMGHALITGFHLYGWYRDNRFCGRCATTLEHDTKERMLKCPKCGNTIYPKISPACIIAVTNKDKILLTKYAGRTYTNYALVAGFTEIGETMEETVMREVMEEVGVKVKNITYYKSQPWGLSGSVLSGYYCELDGDDTIKLQEEELSVGTWVAAKDIDITDDNTSLTREMILKFKRDILSRDN